MNKYESLNKDVKCTVTTTSGKPGKTLRLSTKDEEPPWELQDDPEEDADDELNRLRKELDEKKRRLLIHVVGLAAYVGGAILGLSIGNYGWTVVLLMTIAMFCMDRS